MSLNKILTLPLVSVDLKDISDEPGPYCMSFGFDPDPLISSIKSTGIVNSPILATNIQGNLDIVTGYRRIIAAKSLNLDRLQCRIISDSSLSSLECLLLNLHDNLAARELNEMEKAMVLSRLKKLLPEKDILYTYMRLLGLPSNEATFKRFVKMDRELDQNMKQLVSKGRISFQSAEKILDMNPDLRNYVLELFSLFTFNINQQSHLIDYMSDIIHSRKHSIADMTGEAEFRQINLNKHMNNPQKAKAIIQFFRDKRFPTLVKAEKEFKDRISSLELFYGVRINYPPFFEGPFFRMEVLFKNGRELKKMTEQISRLEGLEDIVPPWHKKDDKNK
ncbi:MAG: ParB N-terminal domain-containing protein [Deltaproteobacteria bacterium]|nr:ParB N-terminal domain-containing protein [Deltaproteobacteria bacterium]